MSCEMVLVGKGKLQSPGLNYQLSAVKSKEPPCAGITLIRFCGSDLSLLTVNPKESTPETLK